ncbi:hypothetical protein NECAME_05643 [Necator americanus]|uniref:Uncharacterized protein n=1 Tax=Necator americanus TaxID=51031 RepID=W2SFI0_NECAM|nr:hypothetical protein NECAME_05643 [Necator americanus]ETN68369.1 hypothetical protein NECAME_05643 [Necator americanus]
MRDTRSGPPRKVVRSSQPSTSAESENFSSKEGNQQSQQRQRSGKSGGEGVDSSVSVQWYVSFFISKHLKETQDCDMRQAETKNVDIVTIEDKALFSRCKWDAFQGCGNQYQVFTKFKHLEEDSFIASDPTVADDDMENDLVDIQPFDSGDTINEVFMNANFTGRRHNEGSVEVSVLALPQQMENIEHSAKFANQHSGADQYGLSANGERISESSSQNLRSSQETKVEVSSKDNTHNHVSPSGARSKGIRMEESSAIQRTVNDFDAANGTELAAEDSSQMEPPVLDGPILGSPPCDFKPTVDLPPTLMADGVVSKDTPKPVHYVVGEIYRVHTPGGTEQEVQLALMDDGSEALVNASGEIVDMTPEDTYAAIDICDIEFNFLDDKNVVCGLCGEVVQYLTLFTGHLARVHPEMLEPDMMIGDLTYVDYLKSKLENDRKNIQNGFKFAKQAMFRRTPRKVSQIRINPSEMTMPQLEVALKKKLLEKMGRRVSVSLVDKEHVKCGICNSVISINKKFEDFAVIDLSHTQPDNLQCIWCGMFIDATTIAVHFTDCHPGDVEVPKCLLCIQELVINARVIEKFGSDFDIVLQDEFHIKVGKLNKLFTSESLMDTAIENYLESLNGKRKRAPITVERRVFEGDSIVVQTTAIPGEEDSLNDLDPDAEQQLPRKTNAINLIVDKGIANQKGQIIGLFRLTNSRQIFGKHNKPKRSMVQPIYRQAPPTNSEYVEVVSDSHWKCKICDADLYGAVISACAIRHFKLKHPQESDSLQFEVVRARLDRISDGCMEFVHPQMLECLICHLTYQLHKPYNVCRGIRHLKSRHPEIMPEYNGEPLRRYRKTGTALRLDDDPNIPRRRREAHLHGNNDSDLLTRMKSQYPGSFDKARCDLVQTIYGASGEPMYVLMGGGNDGEEIIKENLKTLAVPRNEHGEKQAQLRPSTVLDKCCCSISSHLLKENQGQYATADIKPGREVVFELSFDYNNLDADGKPQKHLVRVTPNAEPLGQSKVKPNPNPHRSLFDENERDDITEVTSDRNEANEVFFGDVDHADESAGEETSTVMLGDVLFIDADGNEIIQRTTSLPDGSIQQQYLGQAEDGSLFLLDDIVSAGLQPYSEAVEEVYDADIIDENSESVLRDHFENRLENVTGQRFRGGTEVIHRDDFDGNMMHQSYNHAAAEQDYASGSGPEEDRPHYSCEAVVGNDVHYTESEVVLNEDDYEREDYRTEQDLEQSSVAREQNIASTEPSDEVHSTAR